MTSQATQRREQVTDPSSVILSSQAANSSWDVLEGVALTAVAFKPHLGLGLVQEGLEKIARKFATTDHVSPSRRFSSTLRVRVMTGAPVRGRGC